MPEQELPRDATVIRGGVLTSRDLMDNAIVEHRRSKRWALSVGASATLSPDEIALEWPYRGQSYCPSDVGTLEDAGFATLVPDPPGTVHWLLMLDGKPDEEVWERLRPCFGEPQPNPSYRGKR